MSGFFYNLGRHIGRRAVPAIRKSKWIWDSVAGSEEDALRAEVALGTDMATELRATVEILDDRQASQLLADICRRLGARARDKRRTFRCTVFRDPSPNAMALPGGFLFFSDSLLDFCERHPDELAFVVGHEMGHVLLGHAWDRMVTQAALRATSLAATRMGQLGGWLRQQGIALLRSAHARDQELNADELGLRLAVAAAFAPSGGIALLQRLEPLHHQDALTLGQYFSSHPPPSERIPPLQALARQLCKPRASQHP